MHNTILSFAVGQFIVIGRKYKCIQFTWFNLCHVYEIMQYSAFLVGPRKTANLNKLNYKKKHVIEITIFKKLLLLNIFNLNYLYTNNNRLNGVGWWV